MSRTSFRIYKYNITVNGITEYKECLHMIDYKKTIEKMAKQGKRISFEYLGSYVWNE